MPFSRHDTRQWHAQQMQVDDELIQRLEIYYDAVPRQRATTEQVGPFTLFVATSGWPYYARPAIDATIEITTDDVTRVLDRQRELGVPQAIEWVDQVTPGLAETIESMGIAVARCPLLVLDGAPRGERWDRPDVAAGRPRGHAHLPRSGLGRLPERRYRDRRARCGRTGRAPGLEG